MGFTLGNWSESGMHTGVGGDNVEFLVDSWPVRGSENAGF
jgi:hypothetical protein